MRKASNVRTPVGLLVILLAVLALVVDFSQQDRSRAREVYDTEMRFRAFERAAVRFFSTNALPEIRGIEASIEDTDDGCREITIRDQRNTEISVRASDSRIWRLHGSRWRLRVEDYDTTESRTLWGSDYPLNVPAELVPDVVP